MPILTSLSDAIVEHAPTGIWLFDTDGHCVFANSAAANILGMSRKQLQAQNFRKIAWWQVRGLTLVADDILAMGGEHRFVVTLESKTKIYINGTLSRLDTQEGIYLMVIFSDISDKIPVEQALVATQEIAVKNLKRALIAERKMTYIVEETQRMIGQELHDDLGQHLTGLAFIAENLTHNLHCKNQMEATDAARITLLIQEALEKTRLFARQLYPQQSNEGDLENRLATFLRQVESTFGVDCELNYSRLHISNPEVAVNMFRIAQEAINNAIKHSRASKIKVSLHSTPELIELEVSDNGVGIEKQLNRDQGLGMNIMRRRSSMFGGTLKVESAPSGGTRVIVSLSTESNNDY